MVAMVTLPSCYATSAVARPCLPGLTLSESANTLNIWDITNNLRFAAANLFSQPTIPDYSDLIDKLSAQDKSRVAFLKACLSKLGLEVSLDEAGVPALSRLHITSINNIEVSELLASWSDIIDNENGEEWIRAEVDTFHIQNEDTIWSLEGLQNALTETNGALGPNGMIDYSKIIKKIVPHEKACPHPKLTPQFNHSLFYSSLRRYRHSEPTAESWGDLLMYGEVLTSTNTILEKYVVCGCSLLQVLKKI